MAVIVVSDLGNVTVDGVLAGSVTDVLTNYKSVPGIRGDLKKAIQDWNDGERQAAIVARQQAVADRDAQAKVERDAARDAAKAERDADRQAAADAHDALVAANAAERAADREAAKAEREALVAANAAERAARDAERDAQIAALQTQIKGLQEQNKAKQVLIDAMGGTPLALELARQQRRQEALDRKAAAEREQAAAEAALLAIDAEVPGPEPLAVRVVFRTVLDGQIFPETDSMIMNTTQEFDASVTFLDVLGNPAAVDGVPVWTNSNESVLGMVVGADGLSAVVSAVGIPGSGQISVQADADRGAGVTTITGVLEVEVQSADAVTVTLNTGPVREKAAP
jgi:hypothetical protein